MQQDLRAGEGSELLKGRDEGLSCRDGRRIGTSLAEGALRASSSCVSDVAGRSEVGGVDKEGVIITKL
jgi:hypothetical protein